jgi:hypothetical protein
MERNFHRSQQYDSSLKRNNRYCTTYLLRRLVFQTQVAVKGLKMSDHQTKGISARSYTYSVWRGRSARSDLHPVNCREVLRGVVGLFPILVWYSIRGCHFIDANVTFIGTCPYSPWVTGSRSCSIHHDAAAIVATPYRLNDIEGNIACISVHHYRLNQ